ncbi:type II toxin-antitoxin system Rv0910 family toxin [Gordonia soli]|uniref:Toxin n=1 Tax=Gordonia soli NBRC 108243 TaxID=1223545 RepID=M0QLH6_9ACTN|nr:SRPBCC family protein [Gordonia soli]GAC68257.1 hypothetical protein GS4_14_00880 [Gordonia soli NBRC 108243]
MAKTSDSIDVDMSPEDTWSAATDLARYPEWLTLHEGWRSELPAPDEIAEGVEVASVIALKGTRVRFQWTVAEYQPPKHVLLKGNGKGGVKAKLDLAVAPTDTGSTVTFTIDLGGLPLMGPAGKAAAKVVSGDLRKSLANFRDVFGATT